MLILLELFAPAISSIWDTLFQPFTWFIYFNYQLSPIILPYELHSIMPFWPTFTYYYTDLLLWSTT